MDIKRFLHVTFLDGSEWNIPLHYVATEMAQCLADEEMGQDKFQGGEMYKQVYKRIWNEIFEEEARLIDFAKAKTGWGDYKKFAKLSKEKSIELPGEVAHDVEWPNARMDVLLIMEE